MNVMGKGIEELEPSGGSRGQRALEYPLSAFEEEISQENDHHLIVQCVLRFPLQYAMSLREPLP